MARSHAAIALVCFLAAFMATGLQTSTKIVDSLPSTVDVNVTQYLGLWYQVYADFIVLATFSNNSYCAQATYGPIDSNGHIGVHNWERQYSTDGPVRQIDGYAYAPNSSNTGQLMVHLDGVPADAPYWILAVGPVVNDQYQYAVVSDEFRITLFVLARDVQGFNSTYNDYVVNSLLPELGFSGFNGPIPIQQVGCTYQKK